jgi:structural maintenance of chromosome 1
MDLGYASNGDKALNHTQKPDLVAIDAQIQHSTRKLNNAQKMGEQVRKDITRQQEKVDSLRNELARTKQAADAAQGTDTPALMSTSM